MDAGAWWAAIYGVAQSRTLLKQLSSSSSRVKNHSREGESAHLHLTVKISVESQTCNSLFYPTINIFF